MKTLLCIILFCTSYAMAQMKDQFTDGNFTENPTWQGQTNQFTVNSNLQLQTTTNSAAQVVYLSTKNLYATNVMWEFFIQLNFDPSATNQARIYLVANQQNLNNALNGYFIQIGESGSTDSYDLYRQTGTSTTKIIDGAPKTRPNANVLSAKIKVTRNTDGKWELYTATAGTNQFVLEGTSNDITYLNTEWFGVRCDYTATRANGFIFDDFSISELVEDVIPPQLSKVNVLSNKELEVIFSEPVSKETALNFNNYHLSGYNNPIQILETSTANIYKLIFDNEFATSDYTLTVKGIEDLKGNRMIASQHASFFYIKPYLAKKGDIVINEIFADPSPSVGLPNAEFVELWNTTDEYILLAGWKFSDLTSTANFKADTLKPNSYIILTANVDIPLYQSYGKTTSLSTWPSLNNDKDVLTLFNAIGDVIDQVAYSQEWYKDALKQQGGYSLALIDPKNRCVGSQNWMASGAAIGGTPGMRNDVYQQQLNATAPKLLSATLIDERTVQLNFDQSIDSLSASNTHNYQVNNGVGYPDSVNVLSLNFSQVVIKFQNPIAYGVENTLTITQVANCAGKIIDPNFNTAKLFMAHKMKLGDVLISEVLANPRNGGVDFIEIYNQSDRVLDLKELKLANVDANGNIANQRNVSNTSVYIQPKTYWVFTTLAKIIEEHYRVANPKQMVQMSNLPAYNNTNGTVILLTDLLQLDRLDYHEDMHIPLLKNVDGVSLERISFTKPTNANGNYTSAAQSAGFATPTSENSQLENQAIQESKINIAKKVFSPDGDGFEDVLQIDYQFLTAGNIATINIYSDKGVLVKKLQRNTTIAQQGNFIWDGLNDAGQTSKVGLYVVKFDVFNLAGKLETFKQTCVLATKLN